MPSDTGQSCKVDHVSRRRSLSDIDEMLERFWEAGTSLRELETQYNQRILEAALQDAGVDLLSGEVENLYQLLTDDDVSAGMHVEARSRLQQNGIDPEVVTDDFVSYQTIRTHLRECMGVDTERKSTITRDDAKNTVFKLLSRTESVVGRTIERLSNSELLEISDADVTLSLRVACTECGEEYTFSRLVERGRCSCSPEE